MVEQVLPEPDVTHLFGVPSMVPELVEEPEPEPAPFTPTHMVEGLTDAQLEMQVTTPNPMLAALAQMELDKRRAVVETPPAPVAAPVPPTPPVNPAVLFGTPPVAVSPFLNPPPQVPAGLDFESVTSQVSSIVFGKLTGQPPWETVTVTDVLAELRTNVPLDGATATKLVTYLLGELATVGKLTQANQGTYRLRT